MSLEVFVVGLNYRTSPLALREKLALPSADIPRALETLRTNTDVEEVVMLATCNRVEVWGTAHHVEGASMQVRRRLGEFGSVTGDELSECLYEHSGKEAVRHIFRVASSLDSMVVGEVQIAGQVKDAWAAASEAGTTGAILSRCLERAMHVAKRVRTETAVGRLASSVAGVAADLAERIFGELAGRKVLLVGSGEMAEAGARHLRGVGATEIHICNRSPERAAALAKDLEATARPWEELEDALTWADIALTSTAAQQPIIDSRLLSGVVRARRYRPLFLIDIAVPRDVDPAVAKLSNVYVYDLDALNQALAENLAQRAREAQGAETLVHREVETFSTWKESRAAVPTIRDLREHFMRVAHAQEADLLSALPSLDDRGRAQVRVAMEKLVNRLLHAPLTALRRAGTRGNGVELLSATRRLFELGKAGETPDHEEKHDDQ